MLRNVFHGLRARIFWSVTFLGAVMSILFTAIVVQQQKELLMQDLVTKGFNTVRNLAGDSELGLFSENAGFLDPQVQKIVERDVDVAYAAVYNIQGKALSSFSREKKGFPSFTGDIKRMVNTEGAPLWQKTVLNNNEIYEFWVPVVVSSGFKEEDIFSIPASRDRISKGMDNKRHGKVIGLTQVGFSLNNIYARVWSIALTSILIDLFLLPVAVAFTFMLTRKIAAPILRLKKGVEIIEKGDSYEKIEINSKDEIGELGASFNKMVESLRRKDGEIMHHVQELFALNRVATSLNQSLDLKTSLTGAIKEVLTVTGMEAGWVYLQGKEADVFEITAYIGIKEGFAKEIDFLKRGEGIAGRVIISGEPIITNDVTGDPRISRGAVLGMGFKAFASLPLRSKGNILGAMNITSHSTHDFTPDEVELLYSIGNQVGTAIENSQLYEKLKRQLEDLERTQDQLIRSARLASLGELSANVAHEINNPLTGVLTHASMLMEDVYDTDPAKASLKVIYDETMRIRYIVRNLLDFARQAEPRRDRVCVIDIIKETLNLISHLVVVSNVKVVEEYAADIPTVLVDTAQIKQVILNMFNNALYAMPDGGRLIVKADSEDGEWVNVHIRDTGCGIPENIINKVFDPFFTTKPETKGTGLGLSVSHGIIDRHGGKIEVKSQIGKGSVFTIKLPIAEARG